MCSCSLERMAPFHKVTAMPPSSRASTSLVLPSMMQGQKTMSNASATCSTLSSMARVEMSQPPQEAAQYQASFGFALMPVPPAPSRDGGPEPGVGGHDLGLEPVEAVPLEPLVGPLQRAEGADLLHHVVDRVGQDLPLGGGGPLQAHPRVLDAHGGERVLEQLEAADRLVVLDEVVALAGVAAGHHHAVGAPGQGLEDEGGVHPAAAHQADHAEVGLVLDAGGAGEVGGAVGAPVAEEADDLRLERVVVVVVRVVGHGYTTASQRTPSISLPTCVLS